MNKLKAWAKRLGLALLGLALLLGLLHLIFPLRVQVPYAQEVLSEEGATLQAFLSPDQKWRLYTPLSEVSPLLLKAIVAKEDKYFYRHWGINPMALLRAAGQNISSGHRASGASTITMQVARMLSPKPRTFANKLIEMGRALQLEWAYSKEEILELYINLVPYGGNIEGVRAASLLYFGHAPKDLSLAEAVSLSIIPNRPTSLAIGKHNERIRAERDRWLERLRKEGVFEAHLVEDALKEPLEATRKPFPRHAPHFCLQARKGAGPVVATTIRLGVQQLVAQLGGRHASLLAKQGIHNLAVLVVENSTGHIQAYLGNPDFEDKRHEGEVDMVKGIRSPGSTLKPALYALAFDRGLYTPLSAIDDVPMDFDGYAPENFSKQFRGRITIEDALANSLNVTAVKVLEQVGVRAFADTLYRVGFSQMKKTDLGLSLALGGCGVSLFEVCGLYSALANGGRWRALSFQKNADTASIQLFSAPAAYMVTNILWTLQRPDFPNGYQHALGVPKVAWKTGTSYSRHDAWSIGYTPNYTVGVWVGNANGKAQEGLVGAWAAAPLLFDVINELERGKDRAGEKPPPGLAARTACVHTGLPPGDFCHETKEGYYIPLVSPSAKCGHLRQVLVSEKGDWAYCSQCLPEGGFKQELFPQLTPELLGYYELQGTPYKKPPPHFEGCAADASGKPPKIVSISEGKTYIMPDKGGQLPLRCLAESDVSKVFWYVNQKLIRAAPPGQEVFFEPPPGKVSIICIDDRGRKSSLSFEAR